MGIPVGGGHASDGGPVFLVQVVVRGVEEPVFGKDVLHDADDEAVGSDFDGLVFGALEGDGTFFDARRSDAERGGGGQSGGFEFAFAIGEGGGGGDHGVGEFGRDEVNDEFAVFANVAGGVFGDGGLAVFGGCFVAGGESDEGWVGAEDVEKGKGGGIDAAEVVDSRDPGNGAGSDEGGENFIAVGGFERREVDFHGGRIGRQ